MTEHVFAEMAASLSVFFSFHRECLYTLSLIQSNAEGHFAQECSFKVEEEIILGFLVRAKYPRRCFKARFWKSGVSCSIADHDTGTSGEGGHPGRRRQ